MITTEIPTDRKDIACIAGVFMGNKILISDNSIGNYKHRLQYTQTEIHLNEKVLPNFSISRWGNANVKTGNRDFDELFVIQSTEPEEAKKILTVKIISEFILRQKEFNEGRIECLGNKLIFTVPGIIISDKKKQQYLSLFNLSTFLLT
ncbi:MAG: DUF3137 domain-containing protein [Bacteroidia bacterium]